MDFFNAETRTQATHGSVLSCLAIEYTRHALLLLGVIVCTILPPVICSAVGGSVDIYIAIQRKVPYVLVPARSVPTSFLATPSHRSCDIAYTPRERCIPGFLDELWTEAISDVNYL